MQALQKVGYCTSPLHLPGASSPAPEWLSATGTPEALCEREGSRRLKQIKAVAQTPSP